MAIDRGGGAHQPEDRDYRGPDQPIDPLGDRRLGVDAEGASELEGGGRLSRPHIACFPSPLWHFSY